MIDHIDQTAKPYAATSPAIDAVVLWLTPTIEHDYLVRAVFPTVRTATAVHARANASLHYLTLQAAKELLADAALRVDEAYKSLKIAYRSHIENLVRAIAEAEARPAQFEASAPVCRHRNSSFERWCGTKEQLRSIGIGVDTPYPGEKGNKKRWTQMCDTRGYKVRITRSAIWDWSYDAWIDIPVAYPAARPAADLDRRIAQAIREQELRSLPSQDGNRLEVEREVKRLLQRLMNPGAHGRNRE